MATRDEEGRVVLNYAESYHYTLLKLAWHDEGPQPWYHRQVKKWFKKKWQLLYLSVEGLVERG